MEALCRDERAFPKLTEEELQDLWNRLRLFTYRYFSWIPKRFPSIDLQEVILEAIEDTLMGRRHWSPPASAGVDIQTSLFYFLCLTIRSKLNHCVSKQKKTVSLDAFGGDGKTCAPGESPLQQLRAKEQSDELAIFNEMCRQLLAEIGSDSVLKRMVELLIVDPHLKPRDMADELNLPIKVVYTANRRLTRRLRTFKERWVNSNER